MSLLHRFDSIAKVTTDAEKISVPCIVCGDFRIVYPVTIRQKNTGKCRSCSQKKVIDGEGKECSKCRLHLPFSSYSKDKHNSNGFCSRCKSCARVFRIADRGNQRERDKVWRHKNKDRVRSKNKRAMLRMLEKDPKILSRYGTESNRRRRVLKTGNGGNHSEQEWSSLKQFFDEQCLSCGSKSTKLSRDHVTPLTKGGSDNIANIQPLCRPCNSVKGTTLNDFRVEWVHCW